MLVKDVAAHFGSEYKAAKALNCNQSNLTRWGRKVPERWACKLHIITNGVLQYKPEEYARR
jgi:hypothetical protein